MAEELDDLMTPTTPHCSNPEQLGDGTATLKLETNRPLVLVRDRLPQHGVGVIWEWTRTAYSRWTAVANVEPKRIFAMTEATSADVVQLVTVANLGSGRVLADQMLPYPGGNVLTMRINTVIRWNPTDGPMQQGIDPVRTL